MARCGLAVLGTAMLPGWAPRRRLPGRAARSARLRWSRIGPPITARFHSHATFGW